MKSCIILTILCSFVLSAQTPRSTAFADTTERTRTVAEQYLRHYFTMDFDAMGALMHEAITFEDPTARMIFGSQKHEGKDSVLAAMQKVVGSITGMSPDHIRQFASGNTLVSELTLRWSFRSRSGKPVTITTPLVIVLMVQDGKVIWHRDYGDYTTFRRQYEEQVK
ncbi:MAG: nuclear transport factor 2 family protein [Bacteroidetes bacterium]|nr:nuclear transport factor 2 family protein [Bacteroidota bacterium]